MVTKEALRVVIADDQESMLTIIKRQISEIGHVVVGKAVNGREAVEAVRLLKPDVLLMDIEMPEMDGLTAAKEIHETMPCPVVLLTAHDEPELVKRASEVGVGAYLIKPPSASELERAIVIAVARFADIMELKRLNKELKEALENVKTLKGLLPICANCKKIRDDKGYWQAVETYFRKHADVEFSHGLCPDCLEKLYPKAKSSGSGSEKGSDR